MMYPEMLVMLCVLIFFIAFIVYYLGILYLMKWLSPRFENKFVFVHHLIPRIVKMPELETSKYFDRFPYYRSSMYCPTIDDPIMKELANNITRICNGKSDRYKASYILSLVQQGYRYQSDTKTYGKSEKFAFPVCTMYLKKADCEDGAFLGASLSKLCGLDTVIIDVVGHIAYGVNVPGIGCKVEHNGKKYLWCESTFTLPIGFHINDKKMEGIYDVEIPPNEWLYTNTYQDGFSKYKK